MNTAEEMLLPVLQRLVARKLMERNESIRQDMSKKVKNPDPSKMHSPDDVLPDVLRESLKH